MYSIIRVIKMAFSADVTGCLLEGNVGENATFPMCLFVRNIDTFKGLITLKFDGNRIKQETFIVTLNFVLNYLGQYTQ